MSGMWASQALAAMTRIELDGRALDAQFDLIERALDNFGELLPEDVLSDFRLGFSYLAEAMRVSGGPLPSEPHLRLARDAFSRLAEHPAPALPSAPLLMPPTASEAQALGHLGNYHYFILRGQHREALLEAYSCTEKFPALGVQILPEDLFSKPYRFLLQHAVSPGKPARQEYLRYYGAWGWAAAKAVGITITSMLEATVHPAALGHLPQHLMGLYNEGVDADRPQARTAYGVRTGLLIQASREAHERQLSLT
jgi:hypothetical protein